ncbi:MULTISPECIES: DNA-3-methyladenine glycosylase [unclassified Candidatus Frackibacter]|uniref:DNA-3-methyladenine glycosylase n=1 Tax=unclassified Candidatus Frackibacter TaxID=2648818 RepID=UPI000890EB33|nr:MULTISPECIES: DNA-3-methyladenine glycosylase [unclassified Candidatus Frackibacter]SDC59555.1 DNA-3-methyladenine glycosylase [Candidatus Frackibacter sp. WG11]SEM42250.1 DNA-3-methyladenine glycosylase [Candidatus Frackibacter sp. WG12]SFL85059.1 DNA-3-methyladenine glycosylase [Candidatus Frackibacter sp. WG13]
MRLELDFYNKWGAVKLAQGLLGKLLVREIGGKQIIARIVETEAYVGPEDKACHAYQNKRTKRTEVMFKRGGFSYVYLIYGMYNCFNVVAGDEGKPEAVLVRGVEPINGLDIIKKNRQIKSKKKEDLTNGPGKLCQALDIDRSLNGCDLTTNQELYIKDSDEVVEIVADKRINIDYAEEYRDKLWRFYVKENQFVSKG